MQHQMHELLIHLIYCEMLGVDGSWGYIHTIKMTQNTGVMDKRIGALPCSPSRWHRTLGSWTRALPCSPSRWPRAPEQTWLLPFLVMLWWIRCHSRGVVLHQY